MDDEMKKKETTKEKPLLVHHLILTKKLFMQYAKLNYYESRKKIRTSCILLTILLVLLGVAEIYIFPKAAWCSILFFLFAAYMLFMFIFGYLYAGRNSYCNLAEFYGEPIKMDVLFYKNYFVVQTEKGSNEFLYSQIGRIIHGKNMLVLLVSSQGIIQHGQVIDLSLFSEEESAIFNDLPIHPQS